MGRPCASLRSPFGLALVTLWLVHQPPAAPGQDATAAGRARLGLALQGGGAKGFAHIGVLEWLEEHRIPVDMIAGTSMGGLIGGFYAAGMSPAEIREVVRTSNWEELIGGRIAYRLLDYRRKEDRRAYPNNLEFGLHGGLRLPSGLQAGHSVGLLLDRTALPYYDLRSFDDLPVRFRCVATELVSGTQAVFSDGSLRDALRATMSLPGIFSPLRQGGRIYADGGMLNNLPVDVAKDMGADFVVAVNLDIGAFDPKSTISLVGVLSRSLGVIMDTNLTRSLELADLVIRVDVSTYTTLDFQFSDAIIRKGYEAAAAEGGRLAQFTLSEPEWRRYVAEKEGRRKTTTPVPQFVEVEGVRPVLSQSLHEDLAGFAGRPLNSTSLENRLNQVWGQGRYAALGYDLVRRGSDIGLRIRPEEKENGPPFLNLNLAVDGSEVGNVRFGVGMRLTMLDLWGYRSEWRTDVEFGAKNLVGTEYYRAVAHSPHWFVAPRAYAESSLFDLYSYGSRQAEYRVERRGFGADGGYRFNHRAEIRIGQDLTWYDAHLRTGTESIPEFRQRAGASSMRFGYFGQDDAIFPRRGIRVETRAAWFSSRPFGMSGFPEAETKVSWFRPVSRPGSIFLTGSGGTAFGRDGLGMLQFTLGGMLRLGSYGRNELHGSQYFLLTAGYLHDLAVLPPLLGDKIIAGGWYQVGRMYSDTYLPRHPMDVTGALAAKTLVGPLFVGASWGDGGHRKVYFGIGTIF